MNDILLWSIDLHQFGLKFLSMASRKFELPECLRGPPEEDIAEEDEEEEDGADEEDFKWGFVVHLNTHKRWLSELIARNCQKRREKIW